MLTFLVQFIHLACCWIWFEATRLLWYYNLVSVQYKNKTTRNYQRAYEEFNKF